MDGSERYGALVVTVVAVFVAAVVALVTRNAWTDQEPQTRVAAARPSTTLAPTTTTELPTTTTSTTKAPRPTTTLPKGLTVTPVPRGSGTTVPAPPATTPGTTPAPTTPPTSAPPGGEEHSENAISFSYGPTPEQRTTGASRNWGPGTTLSLTIYVALNGDSWELGADVINKSSRNVTFPGGVDVVMHFVCNGQSDEVHIHDVAQTSAPPTGGVRMRQPGFRPKDYPGPGSCDVYGTVKYAT